MGRKARASRATGRRPDEPQISSQARQGQAAQDGGRLLELVLAGQHGAVEAILGRGVDPNFADANGWTALFHASQRGQLAMVKTLLKNKANAAHAGLTGETALMVASEQGQEKIATLLLSSACSVNASTNDGTIALMGACLHSQISVVRLLLEKMAAVDARTIQGGTAVAVACHGNKELSGDIIKLLISWRAPCDVPSQDSMTPLVYACQNGHLHAVEVLIDHKADINHRSALGITPIMQAVRAGQKDVAELLVRKGALSLEALRRDLSNAKTAAPSPMLECGSNAKIQGLIKAVHLNGQICEVLGFNSEKGRHTVRLPSGEESLIKSENLKPLGNHAVDTTKLKGYMRKLSKFLGAKLGRDVVSEDFLCLINPMGKCHIQCYMEPAGFGIFRGQLVDLSRHSSQDDARAEAINSAAFRALKMLRRKENLEKAELADARNSGSEVSANSSNGDSADDLTDPKGLDVKDAQAVADYINKVGSKLATCGNDDSGSETDRLRAVKNGDHVHFFWPDVAAKIVPGSEAMQWTAGTKVLTHEGKEGAIAFYDSDAKTYLVRMKGGKEKPFKRSQLERAPLCKEEAKKFIEAISSWEEKTGIQTFFTKNVKILRVPKQQLPAHFRAGCKGQDLVYGCEEDTRVWENGVEFQGQPNWEDPLIAKRQEIFGEEWYEMPRDRSSKIPVNEVAFRSLPIDVQKYLLEIFEGFHQSQTGAPLDARLRRLLEQHGLVSIGYMNSCSISTDAYKSQMHSLAAAVPFRLSPNEIWGVSGGTLDGVMQRFPALALHLTNMKESSMDPSTQFAAIDELQNQNARMHDAHQAERKKKEEALQALEETQRLHEAKEKQHRARERSLLEQLGDAESDFSRVQAALEKEKNTALQKLRSEIGRLQGHLQEQEAIFRKREVQLVKEHQEAMESLNNTLNKESTLGQQDVDAVLQDLTARSVELAEQEAVLKERDLAVQSQAQELESKQKLLSREMADVTAKKDKLSEARRQLEEQRRLVEERFSLPKYWAAKLLGPSVSQSDDVSFVPVIDDQTLGALQACILIDNLDWIGWGRDQACPAQHSGLEVVTAWRVEHQAQWMKYRAEQSKMRADLKLSNVKLQPVEVKKPLSTTSKDLPGELDEAVNEVFLLHGTDPTKVLQIAREGLNERFSSRSCFGFGSYMAEDAGKVDQYIKPDEFHHWRNKTLHDKLYVHRRHPGRCFYIFVCRSSLGLVARTRDGNMTLEGHSVWAQAKQRARQREFDFAPHVWPQLRYHSQLVERTPAEELAQTPQGRPVVERYREFVTTHSERIYPEYLLAVRRVQEREVHF